MLFSCLFHLLEMLVVAVLREPADDISRRPVDLESVRVFVIDMILRDTPSVE